ncbi:MAG: S-methyl-5'-thioadenosine phosphorylase [Methanobacteriota archaeon]|nr:MAG: S-methyl-5'-thioadenosine phosphorylase [Euryarchaeota archaeon]
MLGLILGTAAPHLLPTEEGENLWVDTPHGKPSDVIRLYTLKSKRIAVLSRHGPNHNIPPHRINHRANIAALKEVGVRRIVGFSSSGVINTEFMLGELVVPHDFIDFSPVTHTYYDGPQVYHIAMQNPFCPVLRRGVTKICAELGVPHRGEGVYVNTKGPRFETPAEIEAYRILGADIVGMTLAPEAVLAREQGLCYAGVCTTDNYASGISKTPLSFEDVRKNVEKSIPNLRRLIAKLAVVSFDDMSCDCAEALTKANASKYG